MIVLWTAANITDLGPSPDEVASLTWCFELGIRIITDASHPY